MRWRDNMQTCKVNWRKRKLFGMESLSSWRSKKNRLRKTMKMHSSNSSKQLTNFKSHKTRANPNMSIIIVSLCSKLNKNSRKNLKIKVNLVVTIKTNYHPPFEDLKKKTRPLLKDWNLEIITCRVLVLVQKRNWKESQMNEIHSKKTLKF